MTTDNPFLPEDYTLPISNNNYLKLEKGQTKFRFISSPIIGWSYWTINDKGKKVLHHVRSNQPLPRLSEPAKHFWAAIVYDYQSKSLKILEITQKTLQTTIRNLNENPSWGNPKNYDLCVTRTGTTKEDTVYTVMPEPKTNMDESVFADALAINLEALYDGGDPFENLK